MASSCNIDERDTNSAKKRKSSADENSKSQKGLKTVDLPKFKKYSVGVALEFVLQHSSSDEELKSAFSSLMKEAGCSESQITLHGSYCFNARLTEQQAEKLSGVKHVKLVRPLYNVLPGVNLLDLS